MSREEPTPDELRAALAAAVPDLRWLDDALLQVPPGTTAEPGDRAAAAGGRAALRAEHPAAVPGWTAEDAARVLLLAAHPAARRGPHPRGAALYRCGDAAEKRAVLRALPLLPLGDSAVALLHDAIRTNDTRLIAAALGPYSRAPRDRTRGGRPC